MSSDKELQCNRKNCNRCICMTCQHQNFDCECEKENARFVKSCPDYDEMTGEQMKLDL